MKNLMILFMFLFPLVVMAQKKPPKPPKPNLSKAEKALREGKLDVAKTIIDITVASEKFSSNAKAWYVQGVIYASLDTTGREEFKSLAQDPFSTATQAFDKSKKLENDKTSIYIINKNGLPMLPEQIEALFAQRYFDQGLTYYQKEKNYEATLENVKKVLFFIPEDTSVLLNAGLFFAPSAKAHEEAVVYLEKYLSLDGNSTDAYTMLFSIYRDELKDDDKALAIVKEAVAKYPKHTDFPKYELDMYIKMDKLEEARNAMEKQVEENPDDSETLYYLGVINQELKDDATARGWYEKALKVNPAYLESCVAIAEMVYLQAKSLKSQMNALGISKEDKKKRLELDEALVEKLKLALPYWEACEKIDAEDSKTLDNIFSIYTNLGMESDIKRIEKKMKSLGIF